MVAEILTADWVITRALEPALADHAVRVDGDLITHVAPTDALRSEFPDDPVRDGRGHVLLPGFVNSHVHLYGVLAHGMPAADAPSDSWSFLDDHWWPGVENALDHHMIEAATDWVGAEMLRSGTTTFYDILEAPSAVPDILLVEKDVIDRRGLRGVLSFEATERVSARNGQEGLSENVRLIEACRADRGTRVAGAMCYHTTFTCPEPFIRQAFELADAHDVFCHAHCNEGVHEGRWCEEHLGERTLEFYDRIGVTGPRFLASQCVQLSPAELGIIAESGTRVSHMPLANCEVGGGIAPVPDLIERGVVVGLGSDGYINDMFEVMRGAFLLHKARTLDPGAMPASRVLHLATEGGAEALGIPRVGRVEPGWQADLQLVDAVLPTPVTAHNLVDQLVLWRNHTHVRDVM
ncbi:MAG: amidohydrolase family protein, partial [Acidimicrobiales bacterium]